MAPSELGSQDCRSVSFPLASKVRRALRGPSIPQTCKSLPLRKICFHSCFPGTRMALCWLASLSLLIHSGLTCMAGLRPGKSMAWDWDTITRVFMKAKGALTITPGQEVSIGTSQVNNGKLEVWELTIWPLESQHEALTEWLPNFLNKKFIFYQKILQECNILNVCAPQNAYVETLIPKEMVLGDGAFGSWLNHEDGAPGWD